MSEREVVFLSEEDEHVNEDCYVLIHYKVPPNRVHLFYIDTANKRDEPIGIFRGEEDSFQAMDVHREKVRKYQLTQQ